MNEIPESSTQAERHAAAMIRAGQSGRASVARYFRVHRATRGTGQTHTLPSVRVEENLALEMAAYGNEQGFTYSETMRSLLRRGLKSVKDPHDD
jgi:hypothetical protein